MKQNKQAAPQEQPQGQGVQEPEAATALATVTSSTELSKSMDDMFQEDAGGGMSGMGAGDFALPFYQIIQKGSPQVDRQSPKYNHEAQQGAILNTVTGSIFDGQEGILWVPCGFERHWVRWKDRDSGGGLIGHISANDPVLRSAKPDDRGRLIPQDGSKDVIIDTAYHYGLQVPTDEGAYPEMGVISMTSTQLKKSRLWNTLVRKLMIKGPNGPFNPPSYSHVYKLTTVGESKDKFNWYGWTITCVGRVESVDLYKLARKFSAEIDNKEVRVSAPPSDFEAVPDDSPSPSSERVPF